MDEEKHIGLVKWFHDQVRDANYGFIQHAKLGELFFHENSIEKGQDINSFKENEIVVFISQPSLNHSNKLEAIQVINLKSENDLNFLFGYFLLMLIEKEKYSDYDIIQRDIQSRISYLVEKSAKNISFDILSQYKSFINTQMVSLVQPDVVFIKKLLNAGMKCFPDNYKEITDLIESKISAELAHQLWLDGFLETCQIDFIAGIIFQSSQQIKKAIFNKCTEEDKSNIFFKVLYGLESIDNEPKLKSIKESLELSVEFAPKQHEKFLTAVLSTCTDYYKMNLWLDGYHETLYFDTYKLYIITLTPQDQKKFVKKVLKYIHEGRATVTIEDLTSLNVIDYETSKLAEQVDESHLDYSTSIILNVISELQAQTKIETIKESYGAQQRIYDLILKQIREPQDILQIAGFFDFCAGRCNKLEKNEAGGIISYKRNGFDYPKNHSICDGRKAINKVDNTPILSEEGDEYWWCANQKCFRPNRELHNSSEWEQYTLFDFLTILKIDYREIDLEIYLNIINKANRFLKHLKCRKCSHILYPVGKSQYAFYGVNNFFCQNEDCSEKDKEIYLSHCLNGACEMEIDSRDCVKCKPEEFDSEHCGWYVCNNCLSCCSTQQIERRQRVFESILHKEYKCQLQGHRDLGIISCNKCGDTMETNEANATEYERILNWLVTHKDTSQRIYKSDKNSKGKWWFTIMRGNDSYESFRETLNKFIKLGFQIPNFDKDKDFQLIAEPIDSVKHSSEILTCKNCGNIVDLSNDYERANAIKLFHNVKFVKLGAMKEMLLSEIYQFEPNYIEWEKIWE